MNETRALSAIAAEIREDWGVKLSPHAEPYVDAMAGLKSIGERYINEDASSIVRYFLANAGTWRGEVARRVKAELKAML